MSETPAGGIVVTRRVSDGAGYMLNDNTASGFGRQEADVLTCPHCETVILLQEWRKERSEGGGGWCRRCNAPVCGVCLDRLVSHGCEPFKKKLDAAFEANYRRQQLTNRR